MLKHTAFILFVSRLRYCVGRELENTGTGAVETFLNDRIQIIHMLCDSRWVEMLF